jgi:hypothetical protein
MNGLKAAELLVKLLPNVGIILSTAHEFPDVDRLLREVGIHAAVPKDRIATHLIYAETIVTPE